MIQAFAMSSSVSLAAAAPDPRQRRGSSSGFQPAAGRLPVLIGVRALHGPLIIRQNNSKRGV